ncbi:ABC transporter permease [Roseivivax sediminis]|uniref:ABC-type nitrate/sulfonate/bicarbonate transport system, permease component n=1 Tax=Roseivivax sediminis TaxID=936889 RepID=A0A1I2DIT2_9RHOB|nr:ABC transporter permease subunit [Roseivivax sediminis]SFE80339.1 ABC-type nitrate/sulfonate/bicarbonate transport system, permease component [Roseivivax sediminis]
MNAVAADPAPSRRVGAFVEPLLGLAVILLGWELAARVLAGTFILASPLEVARYLAQNTGLMSRALAETLGNAALGFLWGNLAAVALATVAILWPVTQRTLSGLALLVFCLPLVATGPILRVLYGPGDGPQVTLAAMAVYYTTYVPLLVGLRAAPSSWFELIRSYGRGRGSELVHVRAMAALPYLFAGLQIAAPAAFLGAMVGEFTGAERGMGVLTIRAMRALDVPATWALACTAAAVSIAAYAAIGALARALTKAPPPVILASPDTSGLRRNKPILNAFITLVLALALWWGAMAAFDLTPFFAKRPGDVLEALLLAPDAAQTRTTLLAALGETAKLVVPGYLAGLALGAGLATLLTLVPAAAAVAMPLAVSLRSVPIVTTAPLAVLLLGRGPAGTITLVAVMVFFPTFVACLHGLRQAPGQILDVLRSYAAGPVARLVHVRLPAMLPAFFAAARMGVPASVLAVTVVEWLGTGQGVGALMALSASLSDYDMLWSSIVVVALVSVLGYAGVAWVEARILSRYAAEQVAR